MAPHRGLRRITFTEFRKTLILIYVWANYTNCLFKIQTNIHFFLVRRTKFRLTGSHFFILTLSAPNVIYRATFLGSHGMCLRKGRLKHFCQSAGFAKLRYSLIKSGLWRNLEVQWGRKWAAYCDLVLNYLCNIRIELHNLDNRLDFCYTHIVGCSNILFLLRYKRDTHLSLFLPYTREVDFV